MRNELYAEACQRVHGHPGLLLLSDIILADWPEGDDHWRWVIGAPYGEIIRWAQGILRQVST